MRARSAIGNSGSPLVWAYVPGVLREEPAMAVQVFHRILAFAINGLMKFFHDLCARRFCSLVMRIHIFHENGESLSAAAGLRRTCSAGPRACEHNVGRTQIYLRAADRIAIAVMLDKSESLSEPSESRRKVLIGHVREQGVGGDGAIPHGLPHVSRQALQLGLLHFHPAAVESFH